jgi:hypothetical protein
LGFDLGYISHSIREKIKNKKKRKEDHLTAASLFLVPVGVGVTTPTGIKDRSLVPGI